MTGTADDSATALAEMASLLWRTCATLEREAAHLPDRRSDAVAATLRFTRRRLDALLAAHDMRIGSFEGEIWTARLPAIPINSDEIDSPIAVVGATIEPTLTRGSHVILAGKVILAPAPAPAPATT